MPLKLATAIALLALFAAAWMTAGVSAEPTPAASTCVECCEGDAVCEALAGLTDLENTVDELAPSVGIARSLDAKLDATTASVVAGRVTPALNQLDAFGHEVDALTQSEQVTPLVSNIMKTKHDTVKNSISNIR